MRYHGPMAAKYTLYGGEISYYTGKARAYLRYKDIAFQELAATRDVYKTVILPRVGWPVIPVVVTPEDDTLQDTTDIIDFLEDRFPEPPVYPESPRQKLAALLLEFYGDEWLKIPAMHYRWNHNTKWIIAQFGALSAPDASPEEQAAIGEKTCRPFRGSLPALGVNETTYAAIEESYEALLSELDAHFAEHAFLFGSRPSIGDFGLIGPLYAHNYRDPASGALMKRLAPCVAGWVERMMTPQPRTGQFLPNDEVPTTLLPVLQRAAEEQLPVAVATVRALGQWLEDHPHEEIPRGIGMHAFTLLRGSPHEVTSERAIFTFDQWMFQRPWDCLRALRGADRAAADDLLDTIGAAEALAEPIKHRVKRENFRLVRG
jgi:glutathione S-transferase